MKVILNDTLKKRGKSQYWLAQKTGIAASTINNLCNGKTNSIQFSVLERICDALDCETSDIIVSNNFAERMESYYKEIIKTSKK